MIHPHVASGRRTSLGFSMVELVVVVGIIMVLAATGLPAIARYMRNYQIRGASQQVAGEISTARGKAIMKNVNYGVTFLVLSNSTYRWVIEDASGSSTRVALGTVLTDAAYASQLGPLQTLPGSVRFGTGCSDSSLGTEATFIGNDRGFRFTRYGAHCDPGTSTNAVTSEPCPALPSNAGLANSVYNVVSGGAMVCLTQDINGDNVPDLRRMVVVAPGGRVAQK